MKLDVEIGNLQPGARLVLDWDGETLTVESIGKGGWTERLKLLPPSGPLAFVRYLRQVIGMREQGVGIVFGHLLVTLDQMMSGDR